MSQTYSTWFNSYCTVASISSHLSKLWYCDELGTSMSNVLTLSHSSGCATSLALHSFHSTRRTLDKNVAKTPSQSVCFIPSYFQYSELVTQVNFWTFLQSWHIGFKGPKLTIESLCEMANPDRAGHLRPKSLLKWNTVKYILNIINHIRSPDTHRCSIGAQVKTRR